jgi:hypothetical protein
VYLGASEVTRHAGTLLARGCAIPVIDASDRPVETNECDQRPPPW